MELFSGCLQDDSLLENKMDRKRNILAGYAIIFKSSH